MEVYFLMRELHDLRVKNEDLRKRPEEATE
jgi:hypothetical protein